jgi:hypothetical protein
MNFDWNEHYKKGGQSGYPKDYAIARGWKKNIISKYFDITKDSVIDIGCGDLQFWDGEMPLYYIGVDISPEIIQQNKNKYPELTFIASNGITPLDISSNIVICFDMLWHIIDDDDYIKILKNIKCYSDKYIIIYTWNSNPFNKNILYRLYANIARFKHGKGFSLEKTDNDGGYQKYRNFLSIAVPIFLPDFKLIETYTNDHWNFGTMYIFKKVSESMLEL